VSIGLTGVSQSTQDALDFQRCHALARDAVYASLNSAALTASLQAASTTPQDILLLHSAAPNRATYLQRPDLGRALDEPGREFLSRGVHSHCDLAIVIADGLSALAVERHAVPLVQQLLPLLSGWTIGPFSIVEQGRVAIGDVIGEALGADISLVLIGERPGLSSFDSLGAYITWNPRPGRTDAERACISNIRAEGLGYSQAAAQLHSTLNLARRLRLTGVAAHSTATPLTEGQQP
jgi:ethanolamine ammonia-lyase small subunit